MYKLFRLAASLEVWKINYCSAEYSRCARYQRSLAGRAVPPHLMPNGELLKKPAGAL